jgi:predicted alpha/beta superfamily hydrolase
VELIYFTIGLFVPIGTEKMCKLLIPGVLLMIMISGVSAGEYSGGELIHYPEMKSRYVASRRVDVWLPPSYNDRGDKRYPVLYMHDGQNLFEPSLAFTGVDWGVDEALTRLASGGDIDEVIVVAVWNTGFRFREYLPAEAFTAPGAGATLARLEQEYGGGPLSDQYLQFLVNDLKPFIDSTFATLADARHTSIMGSSMGGLISAYAIASYPDIFGAAGCLSTHWPVSLARDDSSAARFLLEYFAVNLPAAGFHRLYFDHGSEQLDAMYGQYQRVLDQRLPELGYCAGVDWMSKWYPGASHSEKSWRERIDIPLRFLLARRDTDASSAQGGHDE